MSDPNAHHEPSGDCVFCCEDFTNENFVEYRAGEDKLWLKSVYCQDCIESQFIANQWQTYLDNINKADCAAALRRVLSNPPPINVKDAGLPCEDSATGEVHSFYFHSDGQVHSAKLANSLTGEEREKFYADKKAFLTATEVEEASKQTNGTTETNATEAEQSSV